MNSILEHVSLKPYNTFGIDAHARYLAEFSTPDELAALLSWGSRSAPKAEGRQGTDVWPVLVLGGGSNILFTRDVDGLVLRNRIEGIDLIDEDEDYVYVQVGAGESWHGFVEHSLARDWAGVENLSLIPGSVGAAPMQNIGAYGVEIKDVFQELQAWSYADGRIYTFSLNDCAFGYRESVFKRQYRGEFVILTVTFRLPKKPVLHTEYGAIREELERMGVREPGIRDVSKAVIAIRRGRLPDPAEIGNAGSFFKNPTVPDEQFEALQAEFPEIVGYRNTGTDTTKIAAGWMIEQCGLKGYRHGDAGVHARQALVLVNYGGATGREIYELSEEIVVSVRQKFGVGLEREVNVF